MTVSYESKTATEQQHKTAAEQETRNREVFFEALCRWPLKEHEANFKLLNDWSGDGLLSLEKIDYLLKHRVSGFNPDVVTREQLIEELAQELRDGCSKQTLSDYDWKQQVFRMGTWSLRQLREERRSMRLRRELTTATAARNYLTEARGEAEKKYQGYPKLLKSLVPAGEIFARETRQYLLELAKSDVHAFKKYVRLYSAAQIDDILNQR